MTTNDLAATGRTPATSIPDAALTRTPTARNLFEKLYDRRVRTTIWLAASIVLAVTSGSLLTLAALGVDITPMVLR